MCLTQPLAAQDFSAFEAGVADCVNFLATRPQTELVMSGNVQPVDSHEDGFSVSVLYPASAGPSNFQFAV